MPVSRRILLAAILAVAPAQASGGSPEAHVRALYDEHFRSTGGKTASLVDNETFWPRIFTGALIVLWRKAKLRTQPGESGPVDFDPFTASRNPEVKDLRLSLEEGGGSGQTATVLARFQQNGVEGRVAYTLRREAGGWRVDDVVPLVAGRPWSLRRALAGRPQRR